MNTRIGSLSALALLASVDAMAHIDLDEVMTRKPRPLAKPSGKVIPAGNYTRQQRRAFERGAAGSKSS